jgi:hypothetical protein
MLEYRSLIVVEKDIQIFKRGTKQRRGKERLYKRQLLHIYQITKEINGAQA